MQVNNQIIFILNKTFLGGMDWRKLSFSIYLLSLFISYLSKIPKYIFDVIL